MPKYRKKPVVIEAEVYEPGMEDGSECYQSIQNQHCSLFVKFNGCPNCLHWRPYINTLEGKHYISPGDYIITGIKGERYPCKPDIFIATYEPADKPSAAEAEAEGLRRELATCNQAVERLQAEVERLRGLLKWARYSIEEGCTVRDHNCQYLTDPDMGWCEWCEQYAKLCAETVDIDDIEEELYKFIDEDNKKYMALVNKHIKATTKGGPADV